VVRLLWCGANRVCVAGGVKWEKGEADGIQMWKQKISRCNSDGKHLPATMPRHPL
jgi:hypothetical protein